MEKYEFVLDERLGILLPQLSLDWEQYSETERAQILYEWEQIRGRIPTRIFELERIINEKQAQLNVEPRFDISCRLNWEIADLASCINDLHLWYRANQHAEAKLHQ